MERRVLVMDRKDNVGVVLDKAATGDTCTHDEKPIAILNDIDFAHKVAITDIPKDDLIIKYGQEIGYAEKNIRKGEWVHVHNMGCRRGK